MAPRGTDLASNLGRRLRFRNDSQCVARRHSITLYAAHGWDFALYRYLLNIVYGLVVLVAAPFALWRLLRSGKRTPAIWQKLTGRVPMHAQCQKTRVWIHAVSVGEVLQVRPLIRELTARDTNIEFVLSVSTASGLKVAHEKFADCQIVPFPFDFTWAVHNAFDRLQPDAVLLVELELWPNFVAEADRRSIPVIVANGRLSESSHRGYTRVQRIVSSTFQRLTHVCAQNETYAERFRNLGVVGSRVTVTGSIKFDGLATDRSRAETLALRKALGFADDDIIFMAGSTHDPEEADAIQAWEIARATSPHLKLLLVPRHPERFDAVAGFCGERGFSVWRRSVGSGANGEVRLLDTLGELSACWGLADIAFVGGTLTQRGGQNMLEPAAYGCPVLLGPNVWNFADIVADLLECGGAATVHNADELAHMLTELARDTEQRNEMGRAAGRYSRSQSGAAARTIDEVVRLLPFRTVERRAA